MQLQFRIFGWGTLATTKARVSAWGTRQNTATEVLMPEVKTGTESWESISYCPHFPGCLCRLALPRDAQSRASYSWKSAWLMAHSLAIIMFRYHLLFWLSPTTILNALWPLLLTPFLFYFSSQRLSSCHNIPIDPSSPPSSVMQALRGHRFFFSDKPSASDTLPET